MLTNMNRTGNERRTSNILVRPPRRFLLVRTMIIENRKRLTGLRVPMTTRLIPTGLRQTTSGIQTLGQLAYDLTPNSPTPRNHRAPRRTNLA